MKVGWFSEMWKQTYESLSAEQIMALIESGKYELPPEISLLLIPDNMKLTELTGDDWNDRPANCNASGVDSPTGVYVRFIIGQKVPDYVAKALRRWEQEIEEGGG